MDKKCILCRCSAVNELEFGPMHSRRNIDVHQNCLVCQITIFTKNKYITNN